MNIQKHVDCLMQSHIPQQLNECPDLRKEMAEILKTNVGTKTGLRNKEVTDVVQSDPRYANPTTKQGEERVKQKVTNLILFGLHMNLLGNIPELSVVTEVSEVIPKSQNNMEASMEHLPLVLTETELILYDNAIDDFHTGVEKARKALLIIRDQKLYRADFKTFEEFCEKKLNVGRSQAYRMIEYEKVNQNLSPIGDKTQLPTKESHARILSKYSSEDQTMIWEQVLSQVNGDATQVTGKMIEAVILSMGLQTLKEQLKPSIEAEVREELAEEMKESAERTEAFRQQYLTERDMKRTLEQEQEELQQQIVQLAQQPKEVEVPPKGFISVEQAIKEKQLELKQTKAKLKETEIAMLEAKNKKAVYEKSLNEAEERRKSAAVYLKGVETATKNLSKTLNPVELQSCLMELGQQDMPRLESLMSQLHSVQAVCSQFINQSKSTVIDGELS